MALSAVGEEQGQVLTALQEHTRGDVETHNLDYRSLRYDGYGTRRDL